MNLICLECKLEDIFSYQYFPTLSSRDDCRTEHPLAHPTDVEKLALKETDISITK